MGKSGKDKSFLGVCLQIGEQRTERISCSVSLLCVWSAAAEETAHLPPSPPPSPASEQAVAVEEGKFWTFEGCACPTG